MQTNEETSECRETIAEELYRAMRYTNDLIKRAAHAGLAVDVMTLEMHRAEDKVPQLSLTVRNRGGAIGQGVGEGETKHSSRP